MSRKTISYDPHCRDNARSDHAVFTFRSSRHRRGLVLRGMDSEQRNGVADSSPGYLARRVPLATLTTQ